MFCPNCGKDCADANFCPKCGTQLQQAVSPAVQSVWQVGMPCPHCGGTKLDGNNCAFCGAQLLANISAQHKSEDVEESFAREKKPDLIEYFDKYNPNRVAAIKALRKHTGMGLVEAKTLIDQMFNEQLGQPHEDKLLTAWSNLKTAVKGVWQKPND